VQNSMLARWARVMGPLSSGGSGADMTTGYTRTAALASSSVV
jgi:hypothetical protein